MHHSSLLAVTLSSIIAVAAVACSAAPAPTADEQSDVKSKTPAKSADNGTSKGTDPTTPAPTTPTSDACGKKGSYDACFDCCYEKSPAELDKSDAVFRACICEAPGACKADCGDTLCGTDPSKQPSAACETCLSANAAPCDDKAAAACDASAGCKLVDSCLQTECAPLGK
ncbi:hypothetical protein BH11MYX4_BH11MYX4_06020 [soil metagenome]